MSEPQAGYLEGDAALAAFAKPKRANKYHARRTRYGDAVYDSAAEASYAAHLDALQAAGAIHDWSRGRTWVLLDAARARDRITLRVDFDVWVTPERMEVRDVKGLVTREFSLKARLWRAVYPDIPLVVVTRDGRSGWKEEPA